MIFRGLVLATIVCSLDQGKLFDSTSTSIAVSASTLPSDGNFSCYQCAVTSLYDKCRPEALKPCLQTSDRCVTHITRSSSSSLLVRRECGLGPCAFESENSDATVALGMDPDHCDINRPELFCIFCCRGSGCNNASVTSVNSSVLLFFVSLASLWKYPI